MRYLVFILFFLIIFPMNALCQIKVNVVKSQVDQKVLSDTEAEKYKSILSKIRKSDKKKEFADYKEDRNTKFRKLGESIVFEEREANIARYRAREGRDIERWDTKTSLIEKSYSGTDRESERARQTLKYGFPGSGGSQTQYNFNR
ncbi:MAG: hypothetical protein NTX36_14505 [Proteobacteria bacterium]|nr:hypothetical protein [Pseudomonadota bacterium]